MEYWDCPASIIPALQYSITPVRNGYGFQTILRASEHYIP